MWNDSRGQQRKSRLMAMLLTGVMVFYFGWAYAEGEGKAAAVPFSLSIKNNTLSAEIENALLGEVLKELARQAQIEVYISESSVEDKISAKFDNLPLEEGIKRLLKGKNYTLTFARKDSAPPRVAEIKVVNGSTPVSKLSTEPASTASEPKTTDGEGKSPEDLAAEKSPEELAKLALEGTDSDIRVTALKALRVRGDEEQVKSTTTSALQDQDAKVRGTAIEMMDSGISVSLDVVKEMALHDPNPEFRISAIEHFGESSEPGVTLEALKQLTQDPDPQVKAVADHMLNEYSKKLDDIED